MKAARRFAALALTAAAWSGNVAHAGSYHCVSFDYPPLVTQWAGEAPSGFAVEMMREIFSGLGHEISVTLYPWGRSLQAMRTGGADCIFTLFWSPERAAFLDYTRESIIEQNIAFYVRIDRPVQFDGDLLAMRPLRIGTAHRVNYGPRFESMRPHLMLDEAPTIEHNFRKLLAGRVDLVVSNVITANALLCGPLWPDAARLRRLPVPIESVPTHVAFAKAHKLVDLRDRLDAEIVRFRGTPEYARLVENYNLSPAVELATTQRVPCP